MTRLTTLALAALTAVAFSICTAVPAAADTTHIVRPGETLYRISVQYGTSVGALVQANGLTSAERIFAGQRLVVPSGSSGRPLVPGTAGRHTVQPGETLYRIAARYGTNVSSLVRANGLASADRIYVGQSLVIPSGGSAPGDTAPGSAVPAGGSSGRRVVVDLSEQRLTAYQNGVAVRSFVVSTGKASTPTPVGTFAIYARYGAQTMVGPGYYLPGVPYVQYFVGGYAIHGTYWHTSFGVPVSHGCVNLTAADAGWLFQWTAMGTPVVVQY